MLKKISSILVALALVVTLIPATVAADTANSKSAPKDAPAKAAVSYQDILKLAPDLEQGEATDALLKEVKDLVKAVGDEEYIEEEYNDSPEYADWLESGDTYGGSLTSMDVDMFWFTSRSTFTINLTLVTTSRYTLLGIMDAAGEEFVYMGSYLAYDGGLYVYKINTTLPGGYYNFVLLESERWSTCDYKFYYESDADEYIPGEEEPGVESDVWRIAGATRYDTAFKTADELLCYMESDKFSNVVVADGRNFPDALAGSYLACEMDAPILLTDSASNVSKLKSYINTNLEPGGTVYVLGGTGAVSNSAVSGLNRNFDVIRLAGTNRYGTNMAILNEAPINGDEILVCTGANYADSLSVASLDLPILLVGDTLSPEQQDFVAQNSDKQFWMIGGTGAVTPKIEDELHECGARWVDRVAGINRYETSVAVAEAFAGDPYQAVLAYGGNFPDGLCGGPLAYVLHAPLLLTGNGVTGAAEDYVSMSNIYGGYVLGGTSLISDYSVRNIFMLPYNAIINWV